MKILKEVGLIVLGMLIMFIVIVGLNLNARVINLEIFRKDLITSIQQNQARQPIALPQPTVAK